MSQHDQATESKSHKSIKKDIPLRHKIIYGVGFILAIIVILLFFAVVGFVDRGNLSKGSSEMDYGFADVMVSEKMDAMSVGRSPMMKAPQAEMMMEAEAPMMDDEIAVDKKVIKNGNLYLKVDSIDWASGKINEIVKGFDGEVVRSNFYEASHGAKNGSVTVKVPVAQFDAAFSELKKVASLVISEDTNSQDVTEQYTDLQARLKNKQREEQAFADILQRSGKIDDVLKVTKELSRVRGEIERLQGRIKLLESQTDMSTINIQLSEDVEVAVSRGWRPWEVVKESAQGLLRDSQHLIDFLIQFIIRGLPRLAIYALIIWVIYRIVKKGVNKAFGK